MPFVPFKTLNDTVKRIDDLKEEVRKLSDMLKNVKGQPAIQGYSGKKFDLNEHLNSVVLLKRISDAEDRITAAEDRLTAHSI